MKTLLSLATILGLSVALVHAGALDDNRTNGSSLNQVKVDAKVIEGHVVQTFKKRIVFAPHEPIVVKDGSNRKTKGDILIEFAEGAPLFPDKTRLRVKIDPAGVVTQYHTTYGNDVTTYLFQVLEPPREIK